MPCDAMVLLILYATKSILHRLSMVIIFYILLSRFISSVIELQLIQKEMCDFGNVRLLCTGKVAWDMCRPLRMYEPIAPKFLQVTYEKNKKKKKKKKKVGNAGTCR